MNLVIVAGGLGSRLAPLTNNIPKVLVNIGKNTGYVEMIRYWEKQIDLIADISSLTVIVHSAYESLVSEYHKMYFPHLDLIIKTVDIANGSAHAILSTCGHLDGKPVMFTWCDVLPVDDIPVYDLVEMYSGANVVFTNYNGSCRYGLMRTGAGWADVVPCIDEEERGGIFGLYYISNYKTARFTYSSGQDFVEVIEQDGPIREHKLEQIIDFGDMPKLIRVREKADEAREFNSVKFIGDYVLKEATNDQGLAIMAKEIQWYAQVEALVSNGFGLRPSVPRTWVSTDGTGFFMSKASGVPIWKAWDKLSPVDRHHVLLQVIKQQQTIFDLGKGVIDQGDLMFRVRVIVDVEAEAGQKIQNRYSEIKGVIDSFGPVTSVNGYVFDTLDARKTISRLSSAIISHYRNVPVEYGLIHGDLQLSNSMVDLDTLKVSVIDPRGYFGETSCFGLADYDIAKLLYSLSAYDLFNYSKTFHIKSLKDGELNFDIPKMDHKGVEDILESHFKPIHYGWLAVHFLGLAAYIKNDPVKSMCAHYHGLALAERWLEEYRPTSVSSV